MPVIAIEGSLRQDAKWLCKANVRLDRYSMYPERKLAITGLKKTFAEADSILILDAELQKVSIKCSLMEPCTRVLCSGWMKRLWTLEEGVAGRERLYIQFLEGSVPFYLCTAKLTKMTEEEVNGPGGPR
jgi:hypothetical protein